MRDQKMRKVLSVVLACGFALGLAACGDDDDPVKVCAPDGRCYLPAHESPEAVLNNLIVSYQRREIDRYAELLAPEFVFRFQPGDEPRDLDRDHWVLAEDVAGTEALFASQTVQDIHIDLTYGAAVPAAETGMPAGAMHIRVNPTKLAVDDVNGFTYLVEGDIQDMFFRRGAGADSTGWYLFEWRDIPGGGGIGGPHPGTQFGAVQNATWGLIKTRY